MVVVNFFNEKGNVSAKIRDGIRPQILAKVIENLLKDDVFETVEKNVNGGISIPVAIDKKTSNVIYAHLDLTINDKIPTEKTEKKKSAKAKANTADLVPVLFAEEIIEEVDEEIIEEVDEETVEENA